MYETTKSDVAICIGVIFLGQFWGVEKHGSKCIKYPSKRMAQDSV